MPVLECKHPKCHRASVARFNNPGRKDYHSYGLEDTRTQAWCAQVLESKNASQDVCGFEDTTTGKQTCLGGGIQGRKAPCAWVWRYSNQEANTPRWWNPRTEEARAGMQAPEEPPCLSGKIQEPRQKGLWVVESQNVGHSEPDVPRWWNLKTEDTARRANVPQW
ncbi:hypothetical protein B0H12DRAFT_1077134 [Mycena haematopus]|nr:hypothetical protein B0H12DRAFT_1077134 [Mycena haematopus]